MARYFYTDPLAAAWMARQHKIRFVDDTGSELIWCMTDNDFYWVVADEQPDGSNPCYAGVYFYVHPVSYWMLDAQDGDVVEFDRWHWDRQRHEDLKDVEPQPHYGLVKTDGEWTQIFSAGIGWDRVRKGDEFALPFKIIQRGGRPFFWPEQEA